MFVELITFFEGIIEEMANGDLCWYCLCSYKTPPYSFFLRAGTWRFLRDLKYFWRGISCGDLSMILIPSSRIWFGLTKASFELSFDRICIKCWFKRSFVSCLDVLWKGLGSLMELKGLLSGESPETTPEAMPEAISGGVTTWCFSDA